MCRMEAESAGSVLHAANSTISGDNSIDDLHDTPEGAGDLEEYVGPMGPVQKEVIDRWYQGGIVSWGVACGSNIPAVYTNLPLFLDWIDEVVRNATGGSVLD